MTKSNPKKGEENSQPKSYVKKPVNPGKPIVSGESKKGYQTTKKGKGWGNQPKTPSNIIRDKNPREVDGDLKDSREG